jgi:hypothetical protein
MVFTVKMNREGAASLTPELMAIVASNVKCLTKIQFPILTSQVARSQKGRRAMCKREPHLAVGLLHGALTFILVQFNV